MIPALRSPLTAEERVARHRLIAGDTLALSTLLTIVITLTFVTWALFHSFADHRLRLEQRWKVRGESALANHRPEQAIDSLHSALAYAPDDRTLQIELATALAAAGRTQEALVYFNTLHEAEPGAGLINLALARLAVSQGNVPLAVTQYQAALDGTWNGDGFLRRREVRLELARYLIQQKRFDEARNQLLIAAGNAADNHPLQLTAGALLEQAEGPADAYNLYRKAMAFADTRTQAMIGAGRAAAAQGRYLLARNLLEQAIAQPDFSRLSADQHAAVHSTLAEAVAILDVFPAENLLLHVRAVRVAHAVHVVRALIAACAVGPNGSDTATTAPQANPAAPHQPSVAPAAGATASALAVHAGDTARKEAGATAPAGALHDAISAVQRAGSTLAGTASAAPLPEPAGPETAAAAHLAALVAQWQQLPPDTQLEHRMERDPDLLETTFQLVSATEQAEAQYIYLAVRPGTQLPGCVPRTRDDLLLLKIAAAPDEIDQQ